MGKPEAVYEKVFRYGPSPTALLTPDFVIFAVNDAYLRVSGKSSEDLLGKVIFDAFPGDPDDPEASGPQTLRASLESVLRTGVRNIMPLQKYSVEVPGRPRKFQERYWSVVNVPVPGPDGRVEMIIHRVEEITGLLHRLRSAREAADAGVRAELESMENEVYARSLELQELNARLTMAHEQQRRLARELREAVERQRRFVSDASHDLRSPITGLQVRLEDALSDPEADPHQVLVAVLQDAQRLNDLVADLLELSRLDAGAPAPAEPVDLGSLVTGELERHDLTHPVVTRLTPGVVVFASRVRLARLLGNLLTNADRHAEHEIRVIVAAEPPDAVLEVVDDGRGIPPDERERIFERFFRSDLARRKEPGGTGLGLAICREIAQAYGGRVYAADNPSGGGRLVLRLPRARETSGGRLMPAPSRPRPGGSRPCAVPFSTRTTRRSARPCAPSSRPR